MLDSLGTMPQLLNKTESLLRRHQLLYVQWPPKPGGKKANQRVHALASAHARRQHNAAATAYLCHQRLVLPSELASSFSQVGLLGDERTRVRPELVGLKLRGAQAGKYLKRWSLHDR